ncbi:hypothetical protein, conserved in T. vivax [Trypanosoma vivax Y486]|uniref:Uncharacterized protein n=1 Tax=Trypanosoma vivax (strain Y486) TaxID=1055687 RepID=F9WME4_TRYVY|nr:hypothetical protein, conserved in T. vivax [Trypanosoma vivax Y486]|eukprot:CCD18699.1 hypothetical protein, conserved in T. vivax [Trypanosoma vivax Y486]
MHTHKHKSHRINTREGRLCVVWAARFPTSSCRRTHESPGTWDLSTLAAAVVATRLCGCPLCCTTELARLVTAPRLPAGTSMLLALVCVTVPNDGARRMATCPLFQKQATSTASQLATLLWRATPSFTRPVRSTACRPRPLGWRCVFSLFNIVSVRVSSDCHSHLSRWQRTRATTTLHWRCAEYCSGLFLRTNSVPADMRGQQGRADCATMARLLYTSALVGRHSVKNAKMRHPLLRPLHALSPVGRNKPLGCSRSRPPRRWGTRQVTRGMAARASGLRIGCLALSSNGAGVGKTGQAAIKPDGGVVLKQDKDTALRGARNDECRPNSVASTAGSVPELTGENEA